MPTCLFTGSPLSEDTALEHAIPRVLGGRFTSRSVTSSEFNNACGQTVDRFLHEPYSPILDHLSPLMSVQHQQAPIRIELPGAGGRIFLSGGELTLRGLRVDAREDDGRPRAISAEDVEAVRRFAEQQGWDTESFTVRFEPVADSPIGYASRVVLSLDVELGALKSCLAAWDVALEGTAERFTRHACLVPVREMIREGIMDGHAPEELFTTVVHGLAYERIDEIRELPCQSGCR